MTSKTKSILALTGTLIIGMVLGGLITGHLIRGKVHKMMALRERGGFQQHLLEVIEPTDEQRPHVERIVRAFGGQMEQMHREHMQELHSNLVTLKESLGAFLTEQQMADLEQRLQRMRGLRRHMMRRHGPHHAREAHH